MVEAKEKIKAGRFVYRLFFYLPSRNIFSQKQRAFFWIRDSLVFFLFSILLPATLAYEPETASAQSRVSFSEYQSKAVKVPNPFDLTKVTQDTIYQINHPDFILQFFFTGQNVQGLILKRDKTHPIHIRWCFFRTCEPSTYDYKAVLAQGYQRPYNEDPFQVRLPIRFNYHFQGIHFSSGMSPIPFK